MTINDVIVYLMLALMCAAVLDYAFGGKLGLGEKYLQAFSAMGTLCMYMLGTLCFAPVLANVLEPIVSPLFNFLGANPAMLAGMLIGSDGGAYPLAFSMTTDADAANFSALLVGSTLGICVSFIIPYLLEIAGENSRPLVAKGILAGIATIPLGCLAGGFAAGYGLFFMVKNLTPVFFFSAAVAAGLLFFQNKTIRFFLIFGKFIKAFLAITLMIAAFEGISGKIIIKGMLPINQAFAVVGNIIVLLVGAFVLVHYLAKFLNKPVKKLSEKLNINEVSGKGFLCALANTIAMAVLLKDMDDRGKILNSAFVVSAGFAFGDHLAFTAGVDREMVSAVVIGKLAAGFSALALALFVSRRKIDNR